MGTVPNKKVTRDLFVDSPAWYALLDSDDPASSQAKRFMAQAVKECRQLICSNHVLGETYTLILSRLGYDASWEFLNRVRRSRRVKVVFVSQTQESRAYDLLQKYRDHAFSFVDATCFILMKDNRILDCFTFDRHFAAAGFRVHPQPAPVL